MILNETLQKHRDCLEWCEIKREVCEREKNSREECDLEIKTCECNCDFDYGP